MDIVFWVGLFVGALLGLIGSILGNLWTDAVRSYLDNRRQIRLSKKKSRELRRYYFTKNLRDGEPATTIFYGLLQIYFVAAISFLAVMVGFFIILFIVGKDPVAQQHIIIARTFAILAGLSSLILLAVIQHLYFRIYQIWSRLRRFEAYEVQIYDKWGEQPS
jgi:hypothetical protein